MKRISLAILPLLLTSLHLTAPGQADATNGAVARAREAIEVLSSGDRGRMRNFITASYTDEALKAPIEQRISVFSSIYDISRGFEIHGVQDSTADSATLLVRNKLTGEWDAVFVGVEPNAPYKIRGIGFRQPKPPASAKSEARNPKDIARELEAMVKKLVDADVFSGTVLLAKDGKPIFSGAYGMANKDFNVPNKLDTKFNLGSMNKMFTGVAIAQLVEKGKLSFDDPLSKFIPDFPDAESAKKIQIKHLLTHTAGLGGYFTKRYQDMSRANLRSVDDMMALAKQDEKLLFEPGTKWQYSNTGMLVLGKVIEVVSGQTYFDYVRDNIYKPAGMTNTDCYELDRINTNLAVGYDKQYTDSGIAWGNNIFMHVMRGGPHGGGYSTVEDLLKFDQALRSGELVSRAMLKTLTTPKPELKSPDYGYGFGVDADAQTAGHSGGFPGINSNLTMFLGSGWTAIVMSNYSRAALPVSRKMESLIKGSEGSKVAANKR
jgi:CubicO group peptidase (beta-lactamase class C family)